MTTTHEQILRTAAKGIPLSMHTPSDAAAEAAPRAWGAPHPNKDGAPGAAQPFAPFASFPAAFFNRERGPASSQPGSGLPQSQGSQPPVFSAGATSAAPATRPNRTSGRGQAKPQSSRSPHKFASVSASAAKSMSTSVSSGMAAERADVSEATRAAFRAQCISDSAGIGSGSRNSGLGATSGTADIGATSACAAPELLRREHRATEAGLAAEALEWEQRQAEIRKQSEEAKKLKTQRKAAAAAANRVQERQQGRLEEHRQLETKKAAEAVQRDSLRSATAASLQARLRGHVTLVSILRELKIPIDGDPSPSLAQIEKAKKKAQIKFHPDRHQGKPVNILIEAEELFKIINDAPNRAPTNFAHTRSTHTSARYSAYNHW